MVSDDRRGAIDFEWMGEWMLDCSMLWLSWLFSVVKCQGMEWWRMQRWQSEEEPQQQNNSDVAAVVDCWGTHNNDI